MKSGNFGVGHCDIYCASGQELTPVLSSLPPLVLPSVLPSVLLSLPPSYPSSLPLFFSSAEQTLYVKSLGSITHAGRRQDQACPGSFLPLGLEHVECQAAPWFWEEELPVQGGSCLLLEGA